MASNKLSSWGLVGLVMGGGSGLRLAPVELLLRQGGRVVICDLPTSSGRGAAKRLGENTAFAPVDVTSEADVKTAQQVTKNHFGRLDVAVYCAGILSALRIYNFKKEQPFDLKTFQKTIEAGVVCMTLPITRDLVKQGIRVVTIAPGLFRTPMVEQMPEPARTSLEAQAPFPTRLGLPAEFVQLVEAIVRNTMLNGETIRLDGSIRFRP